MKKPLRFLTAAVLIAAALPAILALALLVGAGVIRQGSPSAVAVAAGLLLLLPALGLGALIRQRGLGTAAGLLLWSGLIVWGFEIYFPGERVASLAAGLTVLSLSAGPEAVIALESALPRLTTDLPQLASGRPPPPMAERTVSEVPLPADGPRDGVVLPFEGTGRSMSVPVSVGSAELWLLFDTGATLTTLNAETLAILGVSVPSDAPTVTLRTAGGERVAPVVFIDQLWVGGLEVEGVTVAVCEACADAHTAGLLGLNVSGRFRVTVDSQRRELILQPRDDINNAVDLSPWLQIEATAVHWSDGRIEVELRAASAVERAIAEVTVEIRCDQTFSATLHQIPPHGQQEATVSLPLGTDCDDYTVAIASGRW